MEQLYVLGTGNASAVKSYNTCFLIKDGNEIFMTDTGGGNGILKRLSDMGIELEKIHHIFISHKHMDHCLGALWIIRVLAVKMEKGNYQGKLYIYGSAEVLAMLDRFCKEMLRDKFYRMIGDYILFVSVSPGEHIKIYSWNIEFFDIGSKKTLQYGYRMKLKNKKLLVFTGDEPLSSTTMENGTDADWLLREVLCCYEDEAVFHAYEKNHATLKEACEEAISMNVKNIVLWHLEDKTDMTIRKEKYLSESRKWISRSDNMLQIFIPNDADVIEL